MNRYLAGACVALLASVLCAQDTRGKIQGNVTDSSGAVVMGASVALLNNDTGVRAVSTTNQEGHYRFDFVDPGSYIVSVEMSGFRTFIQRNVRVEALGDVTVNAALELGSTRESITVEATPVAVEFNTSTLSNTIDTKMANDLPLVSRNPFLFVELNPAVVLHSTTQQEPFHFWAASQFDVGGNTNTKNDILLDGSPSMTTQKQSYAPPPDAVEQVNLQQNSVDAEYGHSAGGVLAMQLKSGTNQFHGTGYFVGRNPDLNAMADRITVTPNNTRQSTWGGTLGNPILRNRLFNFFAYEGMRISSPLSVIDTLPTAAQRAGDFSKTLNVQGGLDTIFDPWSTVTNGSTVTRTPFPNNTIPTSRIDPTAAKLIGSLWQPNNPGSGPTASNNFAAGYADPYKYWNLMDKVDYNISDRWKVFGRYNILRTTEAIQDYTGGSALLPLYGSIRNATSVSADAVWTINPTTVWDVRGAFNSINDSFGYPNRNLKPSDIANVWPSSNWYQPYLANLPNIYMPGFTINQGSGTALGVSTYWYQTPNAWNLESKISKNIGRHYVKVGGEYRRENVNAARPSFASFQFNPALTANTYNNPNTSLTGNGWAAFLLGALDNNSTASTIPIQRPRNNFIGAFIQDDFKISQRLTLNLGLRYEFFSALKDPTHRLSRYLDLTNPIPELSGSNTPVLPAAAQALLTTAPTYNGAWVFTSASNPSSWNPPMTLFEPRIGVAWKINDKTALRAGWARYIIPATLTDALNILGSVPYPGYAATSTVVAPLQGIPQAALANPFPGGVVLPTGNSLGRYTGIGDTVTFFDQNFRPGVNDRFNASLQRQMPAQILLDVTFFANISHNLPYSQNLNLADPRIAFSVGNGVNQSVANPFYNLLPATEMPGQLRTQSKVAVSQLLRPYPQYSDIWEALIGGRGDHYKSLQISARRPFSNGFNLVIGYNYNRDVDQEYYDATAEYLHQLSWYPTQTPRHRLTVASIYELPFGKSRKYMSGANRIVDGVLGGWSLSGLFTYNSGLPLRIGSTSTTGTSQSSYVATSSLTSAPIANGTGAIVTRDPAISNPTMGRWFNTDPTVISPLPPFTRATNPVQWSDWVGPRFVDIDLALSKQFVVTEKVHFELRVDAFNLPNAFTPANPVTSPTSTNFGKSIDAASGTYGRQIQYSGKFIF